MGRWLTVLAVVLGLVAGAGFANAQLAWEQVVGGVAPLGGGFGDPNNQDAHDAAVFDGSLFLATTNWSTGCEVWRTTDGTAWTQANSDGFGDSQTYGSYAMAAFGGHLYVHVDTWSSCELWRSADGSSWELIDDDGFGDPNNLSSSMEAFDGELYVGTANGAGAQVWRSPDGVAWSRVSDAGFDGADNAAVMVMESFQGRLYAGTWNPNGGEIWRSADGEAWSRVADDAFGDVDNSNLLSMAVFDGHLYAGIDDNTNGCEVWRTGDGQVWSKVGADGFGNAANTRPLAMVVFGGELFVTVENTSGFEVWKTADGTTWTSAAVAGLGSAERRYPYVATVFGGDLYLGTGTLSSTLGCEVFLLEGVAIEVFSNGTADFNSATDVAQLTVADDFELAKPGGVTGARFTVNDTSCTFPGNWDQELSWSLRLDDSGAPGTAVASGNAQNVSTSLALDDCPTALWVDVSFGFGADVSLQANTRYWLTLHMGSGWGGRSSEIGWAHTDTGSFSTGMSETGESGSWTDTGEHFSFALDQGSPTSVFIDGFESGDTTTWD